MIYKLTNADCTTRGGMKWGPGVTHRATGEKGQPLCTDGWIHAYESPDIAVIMNPVHAGFAEPLLWECRGIVREREPLKCGCRQLTTVRTIPLPEWTTTQRVAFGIHCVLAVYREPQFRLWAERWLDDTDRSGAAAQEAAEWAEEVAEVEAATLAITAEWAARAARAAIAAEWAARTRAARWAARAARAAEWAAEVADISVILDKARAIR